MKITKKLPIRISTLKYTFCLIALIVNSSAAASPQTGANQNKPAETPWTMIDTHKVIVITLEAKDESGIDVTDLKLHDFVIYEGGGKQVLAGLERKETKINGIVRTIYKVAYMPINNRCDGRFRKIRVKNISRRKLTFHIKPDGYFARKDKLDCG